MSLVIFQPDVSWPGPRDLVVPHPPQCSRSPSMGSIRWFSIDSCLWVGGPRSLCLWPQQGAHGLDPYYHSLALPPPSSSPWCTSGPSCSKKVLQPVPRLHMILLRGRDLLLIVLSSAKGGLEPNLEPTCIRTATYWVT